MSERRYNTFSVYRRLLQEARPYWRHLVGLFILNLLSAPLALLTPLPLMIAVDSVIGSQPVSSILASFLPSAQSKTTLVVFCALLVVAVAFLSHLQAMASSLLRTYTGEKLVLAFRAKLFATPSACLFPIMTPRDQPTRPTGFNTMLRRLNGSSSTVSVRLLAPHSHSREWFTLRPASTGN